MGARARAAARVAAIALSALAAAPARAAPPRTLDQVVAEHCRAREGTSTLRARFEQTRIFTALGEEERSAGVVAYRKPDALRWEYLEPDRSFTVIRGGEGMAVFPRIRQVQRFGVGGAGLGGVLATVGFGACGPGFREAFELALAPERDGGPALSMRPRRPELAATYARIVLVLDPRDHLPRSVVLEEPSGDEVRLRFVDVRRNVRLDASLFELATPEDYSVVPWAK
jgi:outer membrane lipoprotein carrier protein